MRLYFYGLIMLIQKFILRRNTGIVICKFAERMGVVYIKMAQILAMQNYGNLFTEQDRERLAKICDHCRPIPYTKIQKILQREYGDLSKTFRSIDHEPLGSASISQVHRAVLLDGREVVLKVKRRDVTCRVQRDVRQLQRLIRRFGRIAKFRNFLGSDRALMLWSEWIYQETDFENERANILRYQSFASDVNGKVPGSVDLKVPEVYPKLCTENLIVMEFIKHPTVNHLELNSQNKKLIKRAINNYLSLSFYALLNGIPVVFHGDPHGGNIFLDGAGNLGFLDLGLIFELSAEEMTFVRELFLNSYTGKPEKIINFLVEHCECAEFDHEKFAAAIRAEVERVKDIPVTAYFVEMMNIFTGFNMSPPPVFFKMAKAFITIFGINTFIGNEVNTKELLATQLTEYYVKRTAEDFKSLAATGIRLLPNFFSQSVRRGFAQGIVASVNDLSNFHQQAVLALENCGEIIEMMRAH